MTKARLNGPPGWAGERALRACRIGFGIVALVSAAPAIAQVAAPAGTTPAVPPGSPIPRILPPQLPSVAPGGAAPALPPPGAVVPKATVHVARVSISGATAYPQAQLAAGTRDLVGPAVPLARIEAARQAMLSQYRADGYVLTTVSAAVDAAGNLHFTVTEGRITGVKLAGDIGPAGVQVLRFLNRLMDKRPIDSVTLERYLLLAQDVPGVTLHAVLQPTDEPGAVVLIAQVSRKPVSGVLTADNRASQFTGPTEALAVLDLNSFSQFGERTELSLYHTFPNTQTFGQASSEFFVGSSGLRLKAYAGRGPSDPGGQLAAEGYHGSTIVFGAALTYPVIRARQQTLNVSAALDALQSEVDTTASGTRARVSYDSLRVFRLGGDYARSDLLFGADRPATNGVTVRLSKGVTALGASPNGEADAPRIGERIDFFKFNAELSRTQTLFYPWEGATVALMGLVAGQVSPDVLPPAEKFYLGGLRLTRGYYAGEVSGDNALAATAELQLNTSLDFSRFGFKADINSQFYAFYDWGETWENRDSDPNRRLASAGGGVRLAVTQYTELDLEALTRFVRYPNGSGPSVSALNGSAFYWRVLGRF
jgi:hemolysin activation/secretion protein